MDRVRFLRRAQELGFSLAELQAMLALSARTSVMRADVTRAATEKLAELDRRIADLARVRQAIGKLLATPCIDPAGACPIIASLASLDPLRPNRPDLT